MNWDAEGLLGQARSTPFGIHFKQKNTQFSIQKKYFALISFCSQPHADAFTRILLSFFVRSKISIKKFVDNFFVENSHFKTILESQNSWFLPREMKGVSTFSSDWSLILHTKHCVILTWFGWMTCRFAVFQYSKTVEATSEVNLISEDEENIRNRFRLRERCSEKENRLKRMSFYSSSSFLSHFCFLH